MNDQEVGPKLVFLILMIKMDMLKITILLGRDCSAKTFS